MKIFIAGAHGQIGKLLIPLLVANGDSVYAGVRKEAQIAEIESLGAKAIHFDLLAYPEEMTPGLKGMDAVIFTAGSGGSTGDDMTLLIDLDGAVKVMEAAKLAGISRFIMISSMNSNNRHEWGNQIRPYMVAKYYADRLLEQTDLDYTILRPSALANTVGTGKISINGKTAISKQITRADVAATIVAAVHSEKYHRESIDITSGEQPIDTAFK